MSIASAMRAPSRPAPDWEKIAFAQHERRIKRLQARIVKAQREGRPGKVRALQWLITHSFSGRVLAVKRVTDNRGRRSPGVDGVIWNSSVAKSRAIGSLRRRGYRAQPLRRVYIPKTNGKLRPLGIPTMHDRAQQALYLLALDPVAETLADPNSYGFRPQRSTADAIEQCFRVLSRKVAATWVMEGDIRSCFDEISHRWLLEHVPMDRAVLRQWLEAGYVEKGERFATEAGTPQGGIISPTFANLTLDGLKRLLDTKFPKVNLGQGRKYYPKVNLVRYADDFIITGSSREQLENEVRPLVEQFLAERGLQLSPTKTRFTHIDEGFDFLGQSLRKFNGKLLIKPSRKNTKAFLEKVRAILRDYSMSRQDVLIVHLNRLILGWVNFHRHVVSSQTFSRVDHLIWWALWRWAKRRHSQKSADWRLRRYWRRLDGRSWCFSCRRKLMPDGVPRWRVLVFANRTLIRRHLKIHSDANPYDRLWAEYFAARVASKRTRRATVVSRRDLS
jgi:RNA-directed DNA polymerase